MLCVEAAFRTVLGRATGLALIPIQIQMRNQEQIQLMPLLLLIFLTKNVARGVSRLWHNRGRIISRSVHLIYVCVYST